MGLAGSVLLSYGIFQVILETRKGERKKVLDEHDIEAVIAHMARIPPKQVSRSDRDALRNLERDLKMVVYGQDAAIETLAETPLPNGGHRYAVLGPMGELGSHGPAAHRDVEPAADVEIDQLMRDVAAAKRLFALPQSGFAPLAGLGRKVSHGGYRDDADEQNSGNA